MNGRVELEAIDRFRQEIAELVTRYPSTKAHCRYVDVRLEVSQGKGAVAENGMDKFSAEDYGFSFGVRAIAGDRVTAAGYFGRLLGSADLDRILQHVQEGLDRAYERALWNARQKAAARDEFPRLGSTLQDVALAPIDVHRATIPARFQQDPRQVPLAEVVRYVREVSRQVLALGQEVVYNYIGAETHLERLLFVSSEGADIDQTWAITQGTCFVVAQGPEAFQELYDFTGHQGGWEVIAHGVDEPFIKYPNLLDFSLALARDAVELAKAPPLPATDVEVVVVTDPHYNALLCHEVVGHPSELDRALKMETAYAGRSWFLKSLGESQIGRQVGSPLLSAFSDPTMEGFGHYMYDDEGTPARRAYHIRHGIYEEFLNSRQTAAIIGAIPNGHYKATDAHLVPLIRMSNTAFAPGDRDPQDIIREVDRGYYVVGHRIPSVAESRENFRITAMKVYEIRDGRLGQLYRDGGLVADTRDFFMNVDAVGNDLRLFAIPNCGKGQPMQTKRMSNGGPTLRSRARLSGRQ
jgi:TldD protein